MPPQNGNVWKFLCAVLATALLSSCAFWFAVGNKLSECDHALELKAEVQAELAEHRAALEANTKALNTMNILLKAHGITVENLTPRTSAGGTP